MSTSASATAPYVFSSGDGGSLRTPIAGVDAQLRISGALWIEAGRALVVADLHLEKGSSYAARGQMLPPYDTRETLKRLTVEVEDLAPAVVVLLGDTFHDRTSEARLARDDTETLRRLAQGRTLIWVAGNHDAEGPRALPGETVRELAFCGLAFRHEPVAGVQIGEVCGHLHPAARVRTALGSARRRCFVTDAERLILPAFGAYAGGLNVRDQAYSGLFSRPPMAGALGTERVHAVGWRSLVGD